MPPRPAPWRTLADDARHYWRSSKVLLWDSKAVRFTSDELANGLVDTPCRHGWDYDV